MVGLLFIEGSDQSSLELLSVWSIAFIWFVVPFISKCLDAPLILFLEIRGYFCFFGVFIFPPLSVEKMFLWVLLGKISFFLDFYAWVGFGGIFYPLIRSWSVWLCVLIVCTYVSVLICFLMGKEFLLWLSLLVCE